jgi:hypothetical protein
MSAQGHAYLIRFTTPGGSELDHQGGCIVRCLEAPDGRIFIRGGLEATKLSHQGSQPTLKGLADQLAMSEATIGRDESIKAIGHENAARTFRTLKGLTDQVRHRLGLDAKDPVTRLDIVPGPELRKPF